MRAALVGLVLLGRLKGRRWAGGSRRYARHWEVEASSESGPKTALELAKAQVHALRGDAMAILYPYPGYRRDTPPIAPRRRGGPANPSLRVAVIRYRQR